MTLFILKMTEILFFSKINRYEARVHSVSESLSDFKPLGLWKTFCAVIIIIRSMNHILVRRFKYLTHSQQSIILPFFLMVLPVFTETNIRIKLA